MEQALKQILDVVTDVKAEVISIREEQKKMQEKQDRMEEKQDRMQEDIKVLQTDVENLKEDQVIIRQEQLKMNNNIMKILEEQEDTKEIVRVTVLKLGQVSDKLDRLESDFYGGSNVYKSKNKKSNILEFKRKTDDKE